MNDQSIYQSAVALYQKRGRGISTCFAEKIAADALNETRAREQLEVIARYAGDVRSRKLLEIGSGLGAFVSAARKQGIEAFGVEPDAESFALSQQVLASESLDVSIIKNSAGERMPFPDGCFDIVYLNNVIEHVADIEKVFAESIRVARAGGYVVCVSPNFGSFFEGHYGIFWVPYMPKVLAKLYVRLWKKDPSYIDELHLVTMQTFKTLLRRFPEVTIAGWGTDLWEERMDSLTFSEWAELGRLKRLLLLLRNLRLIPVIKVLCRVLKAYNPLIITLRKAAA